MTLEQLFAGRPVDVGEMMVRLRDTARQLGLPFGERQMTFNSRRAQELGKWAESKGKGDAFHHAMFRAYFVEGKNIAKIEVLTAAAQQVGLDAAEAAAVLVDGSFSGAVDADWQLSWQRGVRAVPTFAIRHSTLAGAQPYAALTRMLDAHQVPLRTLSGN